MTKLSTLCYIEKDDKYLMLHRTVKENDVNKDKWIGVGGHFEYGESPEECLLREVKEETGYTLTSWAYRGIVTFVYGEDVVEYMSLYTADGFEGEPIDCDEGELELPTKRGIRRYGHAYIPMDEALAFAAVDVSGRPFLVFQGA